ncbi:lipase family protein [Wolbachia endosymbiont of Oedothorax gibbosus]|uniref:lipase family protein n=1 Tax=Wolbachia endosymbiont of Oedothorax gibbosus TaxID=931100 RepID=UPI0020242BD8|nr:lipase family protein [Wolbachia endosymbiont of Oedothorax gibbosus]
MDFSFLRNWFSTTSTGASSIDSQLEQSSSILADDGKCKIEEYDDEFEIIEDYEFINPRDPNEPHSLPSSYQIDESIAEIAGFDKEKLLEMCTFSKMTYGNNDPMLSKAGYKTKAEFINEGYNIIPFYYNNPKCAGFVFAKDKEITIAYHGTQDRHDVITDLNAVFTTSKFLPEGGRMHSGFYNTFTGSWRSLYKVLKTHAEKQGSEIKDFKINLTGHSMGGAVAKIAALCLNKTEGAEDIHVATFGDPRVFDLTASELYNDVLQEKTIRVTQHRQDPVPAVSPGVFGYAHVGAQLRVSVPEEYTAHKIDGYYQAINSIEEKDFKSNNSVSLFYYPVRALNRINCAILGNVQYCAANLVNYIVGGSNFFEEVKNKNSSQLEQAEVESSLSTARGV